MKDSYCFDASNADDRPPVHWQPRDLDLVLKDSTTDSDDRFVVHLLESKRLAQDGVYGGKLGEIRSFIGERNTFWKQHNPNKSGKVPKMS